MLVSSGLVRLLWHLGRLLKTGSRRRTLQRLNGRPALGKTPVPNGPKRERAHRAVADKRADQHVIVNAEDEDEHAGERRRSEQADTPNQRHDRHHAAEAGRVTLGLERSDLVRRFARQASTGQLIDQRATDRGRSKEDQADQCRHEVLT